MSLISEKDQERVEAVALAISCAKDVIDYWPQFSFRTIKIMAHKMEALKQALDMLK